MNSNDVVMWLRGSGGRKVAHDQHEKLSTNGLGRAWRYKANTGKPRIPSARRRGNKVVFGRGIDLVTAMGTRYSYTAR